MCLHAHAELQHDPTRTKALRSRFEGEAGRRFRNVAGILREAILDLDVLGLRDSRVPTVNRDRPGIPPGAFSFDSNPRKVGAFMRWMSEMQRKQVLDVSDGVPVEQAGNQAWTSKYVQSAYQKGVSHAGQQMRKAGAKVDDQWIQAAFSRPVHADRLGTLYTRTYSDLKGITQAVDTQISRELAQGLAEGINPNDMARRLTDRVKKIGRTRARVLARTEVINAHAEASLNSYKEAQLDGVEVQAEFSTAGDSRVCDQCAPLEGKAYTIEESRGKIPVHPNCRCTFIPAVGDLRGTELR